MEKTEEAGEEKVKKRKTYPKPARKRIDEDGSECSSDDSQLSMEEAVNGSNIKRYLLWWEKKERVG